MTTSESYALQWNRNTVIEDALSLIGVASAFRNPSAADYATGNKWLNYLIKAWQKKGLRPPQQTQVVIFLNTDDNTYTLGPSGTHASYSYNQASTTADALAGATAIIIDDNTGFVAGYNIGIQIDINTMQWTTIASVSGTTINLTNPLDDDIVTGNTIYVYPLRIQKPLRFNNCQRALPNGTEAMVGIENRSDYFNISNKTIKGYPTQLHYSPKINDGLLYIFPIASDVTLVLKATVEYPLEVFTGSTQTPPFPDEWAMPLIYNLAAIMAPVFGFFGPEADKITQMAASFEDDILSNDVEDNFIQFTPDVNGDYVY